MFFASVAWAQDLRREVIPQMMVEMPPVGVGLQYMLGRIEDNKTTGILSHTKQMSIENY